MEISKMKVLVCDDSMFVRKSLVMYINSLGIENVFEAADGAQAVKTFDEARPDVVFMDIVMPVVTGIDALKQIKEISPDAKVIMASSVGTQQYLKDAINAGAADFLQKPIDNSQVKKALENVAEGVI